MCKKVGMKVTNKTGQFIGCDKRSLLAQGKIASGKKNDFVTAK